MAEDQVHPLTAREALWAIRHDIAQGNYKIYLGGIDRMAAEGLDLRTIGVGNFELTDDLADRLAEAHKVLGDVRNALIPNGEVGEDLLQRMNEALALPPDIEAMVERRIGHG